VTISRRQICTRRYIFNSYYMSSASEDHSNVLQAARDAAAGSRQYSSERTREDLCTAFKKAFNGLEPYTWQLDVTEAILLGLDCVAIAGTGSGKTMPFAMPLLVDKTKKKMVIVISPLNDLEEDQASILSFHYTKSLKYATLGSKVERYRIDSDSCERGCVE
jgi:ATP-dependent helicase YprA (DUF1998 family)